MNQQITIETTRRLECILWEIKRLIHEADSLIDSTPEYEEAMENWIRPILCALDEEHGYELNSVPTMHDSINTLRAKYIYRPLMASSK